MLKSVVFNERPPTADITSQDFDKIHSGNLNSSLINGLPMAVSATLYSDKACLLLLIRYTALQYLAELFWVNIPHFESHINEIPRTKIKRLCPSKSDKLKVLLKLWIRMILCLCPYAFMVVQLKWLRRGPTSHKMTSSCLRPFPPLTFAGATDGTVWDTKVRKRACTKKHYYVLMIKIQVSMADFSKQIF